jgi:hypothetical protein
LYKIKFDKSAIFVFKDGLYGKLPLYFVLCIKGDYTNLLMIGRTNFFGCFCSHCRTDLPAFCKGNWTDCLDTFKDCFFLIFFINYISLQFFDMIFKAFLFASARGNEISINKAKSTLSFIVLGSGPIGQRSHNPSVSSGSNILFYFNLYLSQLQ